MTESAASDAAQGEKAEDFVKQLQVFGLGSDGNLSQVRPFRISTMQETTIMRAVFMKISGLDSEQFAENPWGFPYVPYPVPNRSSSTTRSILMPPNVNFEFSGHPIYWIDPSLTRPTRAESIDPARWAVRMFYVMMALGLIDSETLQWISAPRGKGVFLSQSDFHNHLNDFDSDLSSVMYTSRDLSIPYEDVVAQANVALGQLEELQERQWSVYRQEQQTAFREGMEIIGARNGNTEWDEIAESIRDVSQKVVDVITKRNVIDPETGAQIKVSALVTPAYDAATRLVHLLNSYERLCVILATPVLRAQARSSSSYTSVATALQMYNKSVISGGYEEIIKKSVEALFEATSVEPDKFVVFNDTANNLYLDVHRRLDLSVENFKLVERGEQPYRNYMEMQMGRGFANNETSHESSSDMMSTGFDADFERLMRQ